MRKIRKRFYVNKTFQRFVVSFLAVLIFPVVCFMILFWQDFQEVYREKLVEQMESNLESAGRELERNLESIYAFVNYNMVDTQLIKAVQQKELGDKTVVDILRAGAANYAVLENVCYYNELRPELVYNMDGIYSMSYFTQLYEGVESEEELLEELRSIRGADWLVWRKGLQYIIKDGSREGCWWIFTISGKELGGILSAEDAVTLLLHEDGENLYADGVPEEEGRYQVSFASGWGKYQLVRYIEEDRLFLELNAWQRNFLVAVILIMLAGGMLVLFLTYYNEHPIRELLAFLREKNQDIPSDIEGLEAIRFAVKSMEEQNTLTEARQKRNDLLLRLIYGRDCDTEQFREAMKENDLFGQAECYRAIIITAADQNEIDLSKIVLYLGMINTSGFELRMTSLYDGNKAAMVAGMTKEAESELEKELLQMAETLNDSVMEEIRFYVGDRCTRLEEIRRSYSQAFSCWQNDSGESGETVIFFKPLKRSDGEFVYPKAALGRLYSELVDTNFQKVAELTDMFITILREYGDNRFLSMSLYYDVVNTYYRALIKLRADADAEFLETDLLVVKENADAIQAILQIQEQYRAFIEEERIREDGRAENPEENAESDGLIPKVLAYIDENRKSGDLSVSMVAGYFDMTISHMSHKFRKETGRTISEFITEKKFSYACELLTDTDYSVKDIAFMTGYNQPYSFIRMFKQKYSMTPMEYRTKMKVEE